MPQRKEASSDIARIAHADHRHCIRWSLPLLASFEKGKMWIMVYAQFCSMQERKVFDQRWIEHTPTQEIGKRSSAECIERHQIASRETEYCSNIYLVRHCITIIRQVCLFIPLPWFAAKHAADCASQATEARPFCRFVVCWGSRRLQHDERRIEALRGDETLGIDSNDCFESIELDVRQGLPWSEQP